MPINLLSQNSWHILLLINPRDQSPLHCAGIHSSIYLPAQKLPSIPFIHNKMRNTFSVESSKNEPLCSGGLANNFPLLIHFQPVNHPKKLRLKMPHQRKKWKKLSSTHRAINDMKVKSKNRRNIIVAHQNISWIKHSFLCGYNWRLTRTTSNDAWKVNGEKWFSLLYLLFGWDLMGTRGFKEFVSWIDEEEGSQCFYVIQGSEGICRIFAINFIEIGSKHSILNWSKKLKVDMTQ